ATTTALIALVSAGDVRLDDPVKNYLPGFVGGGKDAVTVRDLLRHRGGLWEWQPLYLHGRKGPDALSYVERLPLRYGLDSARHYSDLGFILLGRIVEIASGTDLAAAVRQLVTEPMGLRHTRFARPVNDNVASSAYGDGVERRMVATGEPYPVASSDSPCHGGADAEQPDTAGEANTGAIERRIVATGEPYPVASSDSPCHGGADAEQPDTAGEANTGAAPSGLPSDGTATSNPLSHSGTNTHHPDAATEVGTSGAPSALLSDRLGPNGSPHQGETGLGQPSRALEAGPGRGRAGGVPVSENVGRDSAAFDGWRAHALVGEVNDGNAFHAFGGVSGHAGLFSTIGDLLRYATFLANFRDHASLWNPSVVEEFLADGPDPEQALGFRRYPLTIGGEMSTMYGHPGFVGCAVGFSPASGTALALCTNRLLARGEPLGTEAMWERVRRAAEVETSVSNRTGEANDE
ncbi:MAG TPA: serine hydrolase domain-containing protein, partial [Stackebrandtia sp.]|uniref:serine hydrolase domain-containing protein n=1 Tax=Stackebrandtia sp. TaxID=2023065 RepID=UPI002D742CDF